MASILFISGAGLSAQSGIRTFRDSDGLWEEYDVMEVCSTEGFAKDRQKVLDFYDARRHDLADKLPNEAHFMMARLKACYGDEIAMLTQNVDDLLERAGCKDVVHLHGTLTELRCEVCGTVFPIGYASQKGVACPTCKSTHIRHNVVMFGEAAPMYEILNYEANHAKLLVCVGTSGQVINIAWIAQWYEYSILNNLDPDPAIDSFFKICYHEKATDAAAKIEQACHLFMHKQML